MVLILLFLIHAIIYLLTIYFLLYVLEPKQFVNYATVFFAEFYPMLAILTVILKGKIIENLADEIKIWAIENASKNLQSEINLKIKIITTFVIVNTLIAVTGGFLYMHPLPEDVHLFFALRLIRDYFPNHYTSLEFFYRMSFPIFAYLMTTHANQFLYYTQHINFQIKMFREVCLEVKAWKTVSPFENHLFYNKKYQTEIEQRLKFCIKRSQEFVKVSVYKNKEIASFIPGFAICGLLLGIGLVFFLSNGKITSEYYLRMGFTSLGGVTTFLALVWTGQTTENITSDIERAINEIRWYNFNQSNKKMYLILVMNTMRERKIKFTEKYSVNYRLGLAVFIFPNAQNILLYFFQIVRGIYSVISVVLSKHQH
ncbi:uncharacterized protein LOC107397920 isoform X2 [Tribolium castaneum]|uniref:uncharacterized protein LOC107397920 isoform X2 n=1 Tax=Tribolium castaneum TaxID=7070 RepID=UPI0030FE5693